MLVNAAILLYAFSVNICVNLQAVRDILLYQHLDMQVTKRDPSIKKSPLCILFLDKQDACYTGITRDAGVDSFIPTVCFAD